MIAVNHSFIVITDIRLNEFTLLNNNLDIRKQSDINFKNQYYLYKLQYQINALKIIYRISAFYILNILTISVYFVDVKIAFVLNFLVSQCIYYY